MKHRRLLFLILLVGSALALSACELSLASDVTPPPGYEGESFEDLPEVVAPDLVTGAFPATTPDIENGAVIYAEKCAPCHGDTGLGDGPDAAQLSVPVAALGTSAFADVSSPLAWYSMVTNGNIQNFMPPFNSLTDQERWDVVTYAYSLFNDQVSDFIPLGETVFAENCAECHGADGNAGTDGAALLGSTEFMVNLSNMDIAGAVMLGIPDSMPDFGDQVSDEELAGLVYYVRSLTVPVYDGAEVVDDGQLEATEVVDVAEEPTADMDVTPDADAEDTADATEEGTAAEDTADATEVAVVPDVPEISTMSISGQVLNVTGGDVPAGMEVNLLAYDHMDEVLNITGTADETGSFIFEDIELVAERLYFVLVDYDGVTYNSDLVTGDVAVTAYETSIEVYDTTTSTENLSIDRLHVFFDFENPDVVRVFLVYLVSNSGAEAVVAIDASTPALIYQLAEGGSNIFFQDESSANNAVDIDNGFGDMRPVPPGVSSYQMLFGYEMAYDDKLEFSQPIDLPADAVIVFLPEGKVELNSEQLNSTGIEDIGGEVYQVYEGSEIAAGETLDLTLKGKHPGTGQAAAGSEFSFGSQNELLFGGIALLLAAAGAIVWLRSGSTDAGANADWEDSPEGVMDAIVDLDEAYEDGEMDEKVYQTRRTELKELLQELLDEE